MKIVRLFLKIFERIQRLVAGLDFIENDQVLTGFDRFIAIKAQGLNKSGRIEPAREKALQSRIFLEIKIGNPRILFIAELL